ncbi:MAG TPA: oligosaccharide flippase family protein [Candidatus Acidoferrales bacterium]|nr:oligosaccharide flippase family protein [Candidatus Acidoferrales bacterium]
MKPRQLLANASATFAQVIGSAAFLFFLYRFLLRTIGVERLGIWSLVLATTSVVTLANQGFATGIVKFVAKYAARENTEDVSALIQTAVISIGLALAVISAGLYPGARWILAIVLPEKSLAEALAILPLALVSLWVNIVEGVLQAGLVGFQRIALCNSLELGASASYLLLAVLLVPARGLLGLAWAQAIESAVLLIVTWILLRGRLTNLPLVPRRWSRKHFRELTGYGFQFQLITASQALREPVTKALLAKFSGLAATGFYDLASRFVVNVRELIVQANQVLIPAISHLQECDRDSIPRVYRESYRLVFFLALPAFVSLTVLSPLVSRIWIGRYEPVFVEFVAILAAGWLVNVVSNPAYVVALGTGRLRWVSVGCIATAVLNAGIGFFAGLHFGELAVVSASAFSLACGYAFIVAAYHLESGTPFGVLAPKESRGILITSFACALIFLPFLRAALKNFAFSMGATSATVAALIAMILTSMWIHPLRKRLVRWVFSRVPA